MPEIKIVNNDEELNQVFNFLSQTIYDDSILHKEKYYPMSSRLEEIKKQLKIDKDFLMYIEENNPWYSSSITIKKKSWLWDTTYKRV